MMYESERIEEFNVRFEYTDSYPVFSFLPTDMSIDYKINWIRTKRKTKKFIASETACERITTIQYFFDFFR